MKILIIAPFSILNNEPGFNRFNYLADLLVEKGYEIEFWTSSFSHNLKRKRNCISWQKYNIRLLYEPGYKHNSSVIRIISHIFLAISTRKELIKLKHRPDLIYVGFPCITSTIISIKYAKKENIPIIIDVQDLWPEAIGMLVPKYFRKLFSTISWPIKKIVNYYFKSANGVVTVSKTYEEIVKRAGVTNSITVYIGTDLDKFDRYKREINRNKKQRKKQIKFVYVGTLSHSYDFLCLFKACNVFLEEYPSYDINILVIGDGPLRIKFEKYAINYGLQNRIDFIGYLPYEEMIRALSNADYGLNIISEGSFTSMPNKIYDYFAAGLPVINSVKGELERIVKEYNCGVNYFAGNAESLYKSIKELLGNMDKKVMGKNARQFIEKNANRKITYMNIIDFIRDKIG